MKKFVFILAAIFSFSILVPPVFAQSTAGVESYTKDTLDIIVLVASLASILFLIKGGYRYITSSGNPQALESAKKTIKRALIGLVIVLSAGFIVSTFKAAITTPAEPPGTSNVTLTPINTTKPSEGLTQVLLDAVTSFMQNIVESSTKPVVDGIMGFLTSTPSVASNSVVRNFWFVSLGIVDSLFVLVVALLGLHVMSASTLGFEELELSQLLPRIGLAFLGANISLFLADYVILTCNVLVKAVLDSTGGINHAWIVNAINPTTFITGTTPIITLIFLLIFLIVSIVLLLLYISRLIGLSVGAVLSPFVFLLWILPKFSDYAEVAIKSYVVSVFTIFVHIVVIQLASSYLTIPGNSNNSLLSIAVGIGLFATLLKVPSIMMHMVFFSSGSGAVKKLGNQIVNVMTTDSTVAAVSPANRINPLNEVKSPRKVMNPTL
jgi:hypothetical protein